VTHRSWLWISAAVAEDFVTTRSRGRGWSADKAGEVTVRAIDPVAGKVLRG